MSKVTGKFQITLPRKLADAYGIKVGDDVDVVAAGDRIAIIPAGAAAPTLTVEERLRLFDAATKRQRTRERTWIGGASRDRGWTREDLYARGRPR